MTDFCDWYAQYPKKVARVAAEKAWNKLTLPERQAAVDALPAHVHHWRMKGTAWEHQPHPATWLNGKRWEDQLAPAPQINGESYAKRVETSGQGVEIAAQAGSEPIGNSAGNTKGPAAPLRPNIRLATDARPIGDILQGLRAQLGVKK